MRELVAIMKRFLFHVTQHLRQVKISTRKVALCACHVLGDILYALVVERLYQPKRPLRRTVDHLAKNATRVHPKGERQSGRLQVWLEPAFG